VETLFYPAMLHSSSRIFIQTHYILWKHPMHWGGVKPQSLSAATREVLEAGKETWRNNLHIPGTALSVLCVLLAMGFGSTLLGRRFRYFSYAMILAIVVFGVLVGLQTGRVEANQPTPWLGIVERGNVYAIMLWVAVLAIGLLRAQKSE
jgi:Protein of unknown function (DUF998)